MTRRAGAEEMLSVLGPGTRGPEVIPSQPFVEGRVVSVSADGLIFNVPTWDQGRSAFGPVPYPRGLTGSPAPAVSGESSGHTHTIGHDHLADLPVKGDYVLAVHVGDRAAHPWWVVSWWPA